MTDDTSLSLLDHCTSCKSKCCKGSYFCATPEEHDKITTGGNPDYFAKIIIPEGEFYMLDYRQGNCSYLGDKGQCTIEEVKADTCKAYPGKTVYNKAYALQRIDFDPRCPATRFLTEEFKTGAAEAARKYDENIGPFNHFKVQEAYDAWVQSKSFALSRMKAIVTPPPERRQT